MKPKHSPLPWHVSAGQLVINQGDKWASDQDDIAYLNEEVGDADGFADVAAAVANGRFIVRACNLHYKLLEALETLLRHMEASNGMTRECVVCRKSVPFAGAVVCSGECALAKPDAAGMARAAIAAAKEST